MHLLVWDSFYSRILYVRMNTGIPAFLWYFKTQTDTQEYVSNFGVLCFEAKNKYAISKTMQYFAAYKQYHIYVANLIMHAVLWFHSDFYVLGIFSLFFPSNSYPSICFLAFASRALPFPLRQRRSLGLWALFFEWCALTLAYSALSSLRAVSLGMKRSIFSSVTSRSQPWCVALYSTVSDRDKMCRMWLLGGVTVEKTCSASMHSWGRIPKMFFSLGQSRLIKAHVHWKFIHFIA